MVRGCCPTVNSGERHFEADRMQVTSEAEQTRGLRTMKADEERKEPEAFHIGLLEPM